MLKSPAIQRKESGPAPGAQIGASAQGAAMAGLSASLRGMTYEEGCHALAPKAEPGSKKWTQESLNQVSETVRPLSGAPLVVDGTIGRQSKKATRDFQGKVGSMLKGKSLAVDGIPGRNTRSALGEIAAGPAPMRGGAQQTPQGPAPPTANQERAGRAAADATPQEPTRQQEEEVARPRTLPEDAPANQIEPTPKQEEEVARPRTLPEDAPANQIEPTPKQGAPQAQVEPTPEPEAAAPQAKPAPDLGSADADSGPAATTPTPKPAPPKQGATRPSPKFAGPIQGPKGGKATVKPAARRVTGPKTSAPARKGNAGKADKLRAKWRDGMLVSLSIPKGYESPEDAIQYVTAKSGRNLDGYAYSKFFKAYAAANAGVIQAHWANIRASRSKKAAALPENFAAASAKDRTKILRIVKKTRSAYRAIKKVMFADPAWRQKLARVAYGNNKHIPNSSQSFAKSQGAVAGEGGTVKIGKSMIYNTAAELPGKTVETSKAAAALLKANPPAEGATPAEDVRTARVRFLTITSHGWPTGMGGHARAHGANFNKRRVPKLVGAMAGVLAPDVRVRLFACKTSRVKRGQDSEGSIGDAWRDALFDAGKTAGAVIGHTESGESQTNRTVRILGADSETGHHDWRAGKVFDKAFVVEWLAQIGAKNNALHRKTAKIMMRKFYGREGWMEDLSDLKSLKASVQKRWNAKHPPHPKTLSNFGKNARKLARKRKRRKSK